MITVFFSWQSDIEGRRQIIERSLERAAKQVGNTYIDTATRNEVGAIKIDDKILEKIHKADLMVADLSIIGSLGPKHRKSPNPNVIYEAGYAIAIKGEEKLYLLAQVEKNGSEKFPFDLRNRRMAYYEFADKDISDKLTRAFTSWLNGYDPRPPVAYLDIYAAVNTVSSNGGMTFSFTNDENEPYYIESMHINGADIPIERQLKGKDTASLAFTISPYPFEQEVNDFSFLISRQGRYYRIYQTVTNEPRADGKQNLRSIKQKIDKVERLDDV